MSFQPLIPLTGVPGWRMLERTQPTQQKAFENSDQIKRDIAYFEKNIGAVKTAADLVADRRLLGVALGAFGLEGEIDKKAFIRKILEGGVENKTSLANRLVAPGVKAFAKAFGFGDPRGSQIGALGFTAGIVKAYKTRAFETAVGDTNNDLRLAMNFKREITDLSNAALRRVFDAAPQVAGETGYFAANIGKATTPARLVADSRLLAVAATAFGLDTRSVKPDTLQRALEGGTDNAESIANRSATPGLREFVQAFGYADKAGLQIFNPAFAPGIVAGYTANRFATLLTDAGEGKSEATAFKAELIAKSNNDGGAWYSVLGSRPLRTVFETALNLPREFAKLPIERQQAMFVEGARKLTGSDKITAFDDPRNMDKLISRFLVMSQIKANTASSSSASSALQLIQSHGASSQGLANLLSARA